MIMKWRLNKPPSSQNSSSDKVNALANLSVGEEHRKSLVIKVTQDPCTDQNTLMIKRGPHIQLIHPVKNCGVYSIHIGGLLRGQGNSPLINVMITFDS